MTPPSARKLAAVRSLEVDDDGEFVASRWEDMPFTETETVSTPPGPLGPSIISVLSVLTSPSNGL